LPPHFFAYQQTDTQKLFSPHSFKTRVGLLQRQTALPLEKLSVLGGTMPISLREGLYKKCGMGDLKYGDVFFCLLVSSALLGRLSAVRQATPFVRTKGVAKK
jgi:hypothetical protein